MPQTLNSAWTQALGADAARVHAECLHRPGNLTLSAYNQQLGNQPFPKKRERFAQSNITLTRELSGESGWNEEAIQKRGERLAREAQALWVGPKEPFAARINGNEEDGSKLRLKFWSGLLERLAESETSIPTMEPRATRAVRLPPTVRHIGTELRHVLQPRKVAIDVYFWRAASRPLWEQLRNDASELNRMTDGTWSFDQSEGGSAWMTLSLDAATDDESAWPGLYDWFVDKLGRLYTHGVPLFRQRMQAISQKALPPTGDGDERSVPTATKQRQQRFWCALVATLSEQAPHIKPQKPLLEHWHQISLGRSGFALNSTVNHRTSRIGTEVYLNCADAKQRFDQLAEQKTAIENELGFPLEWQALPEAQACRIASYQSECPLDDELRWSEYANWLVARLVRMDAVFRPIIRTLP